MQHFLFPGPSLSEFFDLLGFFFWRGLFRLRQVTLDKDEFSTAGSARYNWDNLMHEKWTMRQTVYRWCTKRWLSLSCKHLHYHHTTTGFAVSGQDLADIFRRHYNQLVHATAPVCLAISCELYTDGWISQTTKNTTASSGLEAANTIVKELETSLKTRLKNPEEAILKLCNCLETAVVLKPLTSRQ